MFLGIDVGTSGVKTLLIDESQTVVASAHSSLEVSLPHSGWSEQNPQDWIVSTESTLNQLKASNPREMAEVKGIGLSGQMHGATLLDAGDNVLCPCILWNDTRSYAEAAELDANPAFHELSGNIVFPGFTAPKLQWVKNNEPEVFSLVAKVLLPKDFVRLWLTGEYVSDMSDASGTSWLDVAQRNWSGDLLAACDMNIDQMPQLVEGSEVGGQLRNSLQTQWGMKHSVIVAGGAGDNAASGCGMGTIQSGNAFVSLGTSGVLFAANERYSPNPASAVHAFCHALSNTWHQMGVILSATDSLNWYASTVGKTGEELSQAVGGILLQPSDVTFLPYLSGERTPHNDATVRGAFVGLSHKTDQRAMTQAVMEGVAFAISDNLRALESTGTSINGITAVGGGSRSVYWLSLLATVLDLPIELPVDGDIGAAFGAARLGMIASTSADPLSVCSKPTIKKVIEPQRQFKFAYDEKYQQYLKLYPALKG